MFGFLLGSLSSMTKHLVARANLTVLIMLIAVLALVGGATWNQIDMARSARLWTQRANDVLLTIKDLNIALRDAETGQRGYLLTGRDTYLSPYNSSIAHVTRLAGKLQRLANDDSIERDSIAALDPILQKKLEELAQTIVLRRTVGLDAALTAVNTDAGRNYTVAIVAILDKMTQHENIVLAQHQQTADTRAIRVRWLVISGIVLAAIALVWAARMLNRAWSNAYVLEAQQRQVASQLRASLDSLTQGVGVFSPSRQLVNWNACFQSLLKLPKALVRNGTSYTTLVDYLAESEGEFLETEAQLRLSRPKRNESIVYSRHCSDGSQVEIRRSPMPDGGFILTLTDMTKRAQAEAVLRESQKMQAIGQLTGGIAHDFNNLLTVVLGNLELVNSKLANAPDLQKKIERASWAARRGATLTAQLLAFARKQPLSPKPIDLATALPDLVPLLTRTLGEHIDIRYVERAGLWPAMADAAQLENAVLNLALNARDAMPDGGRLTIETANVVLDEEYARLHSEVTPGDYTMVAVSDTGHGMRPEIVSRVFEPFYTTKAEGKGTGLGLAMVFGFVKQSGGHVKIYSEVDAGTTVRLYLPRSIEEAQATSTQSIEPVVMPSSAATILVVEDEAAVREVTIAILKDFGFKVISAADGEEGLRLLGTHIGEIDLLLTDVMLPGELRGRDLAQRVAALRPDVPVLYMSGYTENSIVHHGRLDDGVNLIGKPFSRDNLIRRIVGILQDSASTSATNDEPSGGNVVSLKSWPG
ncbi:hypothetical protein NCH01_13600 [Neoasaia chiangmaiensis]|nr:hypothetical protein NCH01_13600 [Neoasaia chiangmaiensis]